MQDLHRRRVDGVLLAPVSGSAGGAVDYLRGLDLPAVLIDRCVAADFDQIGVENQESTARLTEHLAGHGHRRIAMVAGADGMQTTVERVAGYRKTLRSAGVAFDEALVVSGGSSAQGAQAAMDQLLSRSDPPTSVVVGDHQMTVGVLRTLQIRAMTVPGDMAMVTFGDFFGADVFAPALTAISVPVQHIAARAVIMLMDRVAGYRGPAQTERPNGVWQQRRSCGCG